MSPWAISPRADLLGFVLPVLLAVVVLPLTRSIPDSPCPLLWRILLEVLVDIAHVYGTLFRTVLDSEATSLNWKLYLVAGPGLLAVSLCVNVLFGVQIGWSLLAYYAIFHFAKQPFGLLCVYKARCGERDPVDHRLDYWACIAGAGIPILLWHAGEFGDFTWFGLDDRRLFRLPARLRGPLWWLYVLVPGVWLWRLMRRTSAGAPLNIGKVWIMAAHYFTWYMGMTANQVRNLAFINLFHGFSSMVLVRHVVQQRYRAWRSTRPETMCRRDVFNEAVVASPCRYVGLCVALASVEIVAWEVLVARDYFPALGYTLPELAETEEAVATSVLMLPQLSHYFLDGFIWRTTVRNPGLRRVLLEPGADTKASQ